MESRREDVERLFQPWLDWSRDAEVLALLDVVARELERRGYVVQVEIQPPAEGRP